MHPAKSHSGHLVKLLSALLISAIFAGMAFAQAPGKIVTFNRADTEHCKVIVASGKPLLPGHEFSKSTAGFSELILVWVGPGLISGRS